MKITNVMGLPAALVSMIDTEPHNKSGELSVTTLLSGTREIILTARHWNEISVDVSDLIRSIFGKVGHRMLEEKDETGHAEENLFSMVDGIKVTGRMDLYDMNDFTITDYKFVSVWKIIKGDFDDWRRQGQGYAWLLYQNGFAANESKFVAMLDGYKADEAESDPNYPQKPIYVARFRVNPSDIYDFDRFVRAKVREFKAANELTDDELPICSAKERWERPTQFAVMKEGGTRSSKLCFTREEAERYIESKPRGNYTVEERPGESVKCKAYCQARAFCSYAKKIKEEAKC